MLARNGLMVNDDVAVSWISTDCVQGSFQAVFFDDCSHVVFQLDEYTFLHWMQRVECDTVVSFQRDTTNKSLVVR